PYTTLFRSSDGGWSVPTATEGWHAPKRDDGGWQAPKPKPQMQGWRVPTLPQNLDVTPTESGDWHLPKPEDTILTPEDKSVVTEQPENVEEAEFILPHDAEEEVEEEVEPLPFDETPVTAVDEAGASAVDAGVDAVIPAEAETEASAEEATTGALEMLDEDDDEDTFSMSELVALASLVDNAPSVPLQPAESVAEQVSSTD